MRVALLCCWLDCDSSLAGASLVIRVCRDGSDLQEKETMSEQNKNKSGEFWNRVCANACKHPNLVISPPPPRRSAMSRPSSACVRTPPLVVMVTSLLPTSQVILRPPANKNSAMGDLRGKPDLAPPYLPPVLPTLQKSSNHTKHTDIWKETLANLLGNAEKLENTYRAIMSRQVSVSSRWTVFSPSSA